MADTDIGFGSKFQRGTGSDPIVYADIGEAIDFKMPELTRDTKDATHYNSPDRFKEFIFGLRDGGEFGVTIQFKDIAALDDLMADFMTDTALPYQFLFPDETAWQFTGGITKIGPAVPMEERMTAEFTFKISGKPGFIA